MKNVLIVDEDLGFVFWLGQSLDAAGYQALPAKGVRDAISLLGEFNVEIDILILRYGMPGGEALADHLRRTQSGQLKLVALLDEGLEPIAPPGHWDAWQLKPHLPDDGARWNFLKLIQGLLARAAVPTA